MLTKEALSEWRHSFVTKEVIKRLQSDRQDLLEQMGRGAFINMENAVETLANACKMSGVIEGINMFLNLEEETDET